MPTNVYLPTSRSSESEVLDPTKNDVRIIYTIYYYMIIIHFIDHYFEQKTILNHHQQSGNIFQKIV